MNGLVLSSGYLYGSRYGRLSVIGDICVESFPIAVDAFLFLFFLPTDLKEPDHLSRHNVSTGMKWAGSKWSS